MKALLLVAVLAQTPKERIDAWLDKRWEAAPAATDELVKALREWRLDCAAVEKLLREGRASYPEPPQERGKLTQGVALECEHVDHETQLIIYVPTSYDPKKAAPLVIVGHGGSSGRDLKFGARAALLGMQPYWTDCAEKHGFLVVAPLTDRGWGSIGNSILMSAISKVSRDYRVDPDRIYITGHSMGGHLTWRSAMYLADRWAAVSPMSGGYDYVKDRQARLCFNVPGYATYCTREPYQIDEFNGIIREWMEERAYPWVFRQGEGSHTILADEIEPIWEFFEKHPRDLYRAKVWAQGGGPLEWATPDAKNDAWPKAHTWRTGRPISCATFHWLRLVPLPKDTPAEKAGQFVWAVNKGGNAFEITAENARALKIYLHPKMVDFSKNVTVVVNGKKQFDRKVVPDLKSMLELVREFDDRGRIYHAVIQVDVPGSVAPPEPTYK